MTRSAGVLALVRGVERGIAIVVILRLLQRLRQDGLKKLAKAIAGSALGYAKVLPGVQGVVQAEVGKEIAKIEQRMHGTGDPTAVVSLPAQGRSMSEVLALATERTANEDKSGKSWGGIYHETRGGEHELLKLQAEMWARFNTTNARYPTIFTSVRKFEAEIISCVVGMVHGHESKPHLKAPAVSDWKAWNCEGLAVGLLTSGGTESILIAICAYRELAHKRGIEAPEVVGCYTAHPALNKACHYFGVKLIKVKAESSTQQFRAADAESAMTRNTIAIYASAPTFPHGVVDPIPELAALARRKDVGLHVDNCLGGFWLSFLQRAGKFSMPFDFQLPGVTTISVDVHKYGFASKGASVVAFRNNELRRLTFFPIIDGPTLYVTPTLQGARSGATMAAAWATLLHMGESGYTAAVDKLHGIFEEVRNVVKGTDGVRLLCESHLAVVPVISDDDAINIYAVASEMGKRGWNMFTSAGPPSMSFCIGEQHEHLIKEWAADLRDSIAFLRENPDTKIEGDAGVYGSTEMLPDEIVGEVVRSYLDVKLAVVPAKL